MNAFTSPRQSRLEWGTEQAFGLSNNGLDFDRVFFYLVFNPKDDPILTARLRVIGQIPSNS